MGAGKSTVSAKLSELLAMEIMEMDAHIQEKEGMSIKEIFAVNGEEYFATAKAIPSSNYARKSTWLSPAAAAYPSERKTYNSRIGNTRILLLRIILDI